MLPVMAAKDVNKITVILGDSGPALRVMCAILRLPSYRIKDEFEVWKQHFDQSSLQKFLLYTCYKNNLEMFRFFLDRGAKIDTPVHIGVPNRHADGSTVTHVANWIENQTYVRDTFEYEAEEIRTSDAKTIDILEYICGKHCVEFLEHLSYNTPLFIPRALVCACRVSSETCFRYLLGRPAIREYVNQPDHNHEYPLIVAAEHSPQFILDLVAVGADVNRAQACRNSHVLSCIEVLLSYNGHLPEQLQLVTFLQDVGAKINELSTVLVSCCQYQWLLRGLGSGPPTIHHDNPSTICVPYLFGKVPNINPPALRPQPHRLQGNDGLSDEDVLEFEKMLERTYDIIKYLTGKAKTAVVEAAAQTHIEYFVVLLTKCQWFVIPGVVSLFLRHWRKTICFFLGKGVELHQLDNSRGGSLADLMTSCINHMLDTCVSSHILTVVMFLNLHGSRLSFHAAEDLAMYVHISASTLAILMEFSDDFLAGLSIEDVLAQCREYQDDLYHHLRVVNLKLGQPARLSTMSKVVILQALGAQVLESTVRDLPIPHLMLVPFTNQ